MEFDSKQPKAPRRAQARENLNGNGPALAEAMIGQIDRMAELGKQTARTAALLKEIFDELPNRCIGVDTEPFEQKARSALYEMDRRIRYLKQPPVVLKVIVGLFLTCLVTTLAAGYYIQQSRKWKYSSAYCEQLYEQEKAAQPGKNVKRQK